MPKPPVTLDLIMTEMKRAKKPLTKTEVAERVGTTPQNAHHILMGQLFPSGLVEIVGKTPTQANLFRWNPKAEADGAQPIPRNRLKKAGRGKSPSRQPGETTIQRTRVKGSGGQVDVIELEGMDQAQLLAYIQPWIGQEIRIDGVRITAGGIVLADVTMGNGETRVIELKTT